MGNSYIENTRLRSKRTKIRLKKEDFEKFVREQDKKRWELWRMRREIPLVPLPEPYQKGFVRFFVLREDIARSKNADFFTELLEKINTYQYSDNRKFQKKKRRKGKKVFVDRNQSLARFTEYEFLHSKKLNLSDKERSYFVKAEEYCPHRKAYQIYYEFRDAWRYVLRVKPYMITHYKPLDIDLEREIAQMEAFFENPKVYGIFWKKIRGRSYAWKDVEKKKGKEKYKNPLRNFNFKNLENSATEVAEMLLNKTKFYKQ